MQSLQQNFVKLFPPNELLSAKRQAFASADGGVLLRNPAVEEVVAAALDVAGGSLEHAAIIEQYISLTIPKMEDGNNFGVTVQLALLKQISDFTEKTLKQTEELTKYYAARADAVEKCKYLGTTSTSKSTTTSKSNGTSTGGKDDDDSGKPKNSSSEETKTEEKRSESNTQTPEGPLRAEAVVTGVDVLYYAKAKTLYSTVVSGYCSVLDFLEKNEEKLGAPKGSAGSRSYHSMY